MGDGGCLTAFLVPLYLDPGKGFSSRLTLAVSILPCLRCIALLFVCLTERLVVFMGDNFYGDVVVKATTQSL